MPWSAGCIINMFDSEFSAHADPMAERFTTIAIEKIGPIARLTLARPERANALNAAMLGEIGTALDDIERDAGVRA